MEMNYCMHCGTRLRLREHETEGRPIPWCETCQDYRFPVFNTAVSMVVWDAAHARVLLIRQYGRPFNILPAGYVNQGENAEDAVRRELMEELHLTTSALRFNRSQYFAPSNSLLLNFAVTVREDTPVPNWEVDGWQWFTPREARQAVKPDSLAQRFLEYCLAKEGENGHEE